MNNRTREFIEKNIDSDVRQLALQGCRDKAVDFSLALRQIAGRQIARRKLPSWAALDEILYPPHLNLEQCSSEQTARYKADICRRLLSTIHDSPTTLFDLTGGFGVDFSFMSQAFQASTYVECDNELFSISSKNLAILAPQAQYINGDGLEILHQMTRDTMIFLDPARRDNHGGRTYGIADCVPNVLEIRDELLQKADYVMLKLSPMLDWRKAVSDLGESHVSEIHIVSVQNECKELLIIMQQNNENELTIHCVNDDAVFSYHPSASNNSHNSHLPSFTHLYEPNASLMKAGCFTEIEQAFGIQQLAQNSHLFVADKLLADFPGRSFQVLAVSSMNRQDLKAALQDMQQANITVRNFPMSVAELRKRLKLREGGSIYLFATTLPDGKRVLIICQHA